MALLRQWMSRIRKPARLIGLWRLPGRNSLPTITGLHGTFPDPAAYTAVPAQRSAPGAPKEIKERKMDGTIIGLVAVIMSLGIPLGAMYTYYRVRKLRTEERLAAIARGVSVPMEPELTQGARSRRWGILFVCGGIGFLVALGLIAQIEHERETWSAAVLGIIPFAIGVGYFLEFTLIRRDLQAS